MPEAGGQFAIKRNAVQRALVRRKSRKAIETFSIIDFSRAGRLGALKRIGSPMSRAHQRKKEIIMSEGSVATPFGQRFESRVPLASFTFGLLHADDVVRLHANGLYVIGAMTAANREPRGKQRLSFALVRPGRAVGPRAPRRSRRRQTDGPTRTRMAYGDGAHRRVQRLIRHDPDGLRTCLLFKDEAHSDD
jgi:hypothetical protein